MVSVFLCYFLPAICALTGPLGGKVHLMKERGMGGDGGGLWVIHPPPPSINSPGMQGPSGGPPGSVHVLTPIATAGILMMTIVHCSVHLKTQTTGVRTEQDAPDINPTMVHFITCCTSHLSK